MDIHKETVTKFNKKCQYIKTIKKYGAIRFIYQQWLVSFDNGYGASIISNIRKDTISESEYIFSYGTDYAPYEVAVINNSTKCIDYTTSITNDVVGYLNEKQVEKLLIKIKKLPSII